MQINAFLQENYAEYINDVSNWVEDQYKRNFKDCFDSVRVIQHRMQSQTRTISDSELETILTELPMQLFSISENLNKIRLEAEVIKLRKKQVKADLDQKALQMVSEKEIPKDAMKSWVDTELAEHDVLLAAYSSLITRVESDISFSKELIMGCKKIWDARRRTEQSNPVGEVVPSDLPKYPVNAPKDKYREPYIYDSKFGDMR